MTSICILAKLHIGVFFSGGKLGKIEVKILNWKKFNPRNDVKNPSWFRMNADFLHSESMFKLSVYHKFLWVSMLCLATKKENSGSFLIEIDYFSHISGVSGKEIEKALQVFENRGLITYTYESVRTRPDPYATNVTNERTNERVNIEKIPKFNFEEIYNAYPKKIGKQKGLKSCEIIITSNKIFTRVLNAVNNYSKICKNENTERKFMKQFSTFMNCWEDYEEIETRNDEQINEDNLEAFFKRHE